MAKENNKTAPNTNVDVDQLTATEGFFDKYKNILIYSGIGIVVVLLGIVGYQKLVSEPNNIESQNEIYNALYDFEKDYYEDAKANGKKRLKPTNEERTAFMKRKLDDVERQYKDAQGVIDMKTFDEQAVDAFNENEKQLEKSLKDEEQRQKDNTVISTGEDGEAITLSGYVDTVLQNFNVVEPPKIREAVLTGVIKATKDKTAEEVAFEKIQLPKIKRYITSIFGTTLNQEIIDMMSNEDLKTIIENIADNLGMDKKANKQIANIIKSIIGE